VFYFKTLAFSVFVFNTKSPPFSSCSVILLDLGATSPFLDSVLKLIY